MLAGKTDPEALMPQGSEKRNPQTRDIRAKSAGSNAKYIDLADKCGALVDLARLIAEADG